MVVMLFELNMHSMSGVATTIATECLKALTSIVTLWLQGKCPYALIEFIVNVPLTPLRKLDNGIYLIAVGMVWRH